MESISYTIKGVEPLLLNNPQTVDPLNTYSKQMKEITSKRKKTDDDTLELRRIEVESKLYFEEPTGVYVPSTWIVAALAGVSWAKGKIKKADIRGGVFPTTAKIPLRFRGAEKVRTMRDISCNPEFVRVLLLKQGQVKVAKAVPIFHDWSISGEIEFDPTVMNRSELIRLMQSAALYGGFGDFRPTYGRATFTVD